MRLLKRVKLLKVENVCQTYVNLLVVQYSCSECRAGLYSSGVGLVYSVEVGHSLAQKEEVMTARCLEHTNPATDLGDYSNFILGTRMKQNSCFLQTSCAETQEVQVLVWDQKPARVALEELEVLLVWINVNPGYKLKSQKGLTSG